MEHRDHVRLIGRGVRGAGPVWADLGSGRGAFTLALADLLLSEGRESATIHSVDRDGAALRDQAREVARRFPAVALIVHAADFTRPLPIPTLDGLVMANALHFVHDPVPALELVHGYLRPGGRLVLVEYDAERGNAWVPFPISWR
ncbi:MAG TPA: methyltransferase domain-containing protein, partial [Candidatus Dormibacteraeota bacterium]|nr:methyltransferase domain-containing protein [Candidatus Dormibacteraeota bacterium]